MSWKKSTFFFAWQTIRFAESWSHFKKIWSYRSQWLGSFRSGKNSVSDEQAWITFEAIDCLKDLIQSDFQIFEFGGGGSTLFFCQRAKHVVTVEDHAEWFSRLSEIIHAKNYQNWEGYFVEPEKIEDQRPRSPKNPADFVSGAKGLSSISYERYARAIDPFPGEFFDLILVDGRARPSCIMQALPHLKPKGFLVIDNTERAYYMEPFRQIFNREYDTILDSRYPTPYSPDFTKTTILKKK